VFNEDSGDELVEINTIEDENPSIHMNPNPMTKSRVQKKRKKTSIVWTHFDEVPSKIQMTKGYGHNANFVITNT
jgi:hypothetical protein